MGAPPDGSSRSRDISRLGVMPYVPKPLTSGSKAKGRFGKQDFVYLADDDAYRCPAGQTLTRCFNSVEDGMNAYLYRTTKCAQYADHQQRPQQHHARLADHRHGRPHQAGRRHADPERHQHLLRWHDDR
jgi:hypothetical protein